MTVDISSGDNGLLERKQGFKLIRFKFTLPISDRLL